MLSHKLTGTTRRIDVNAIAGGGGVIPPAISGWPNIKTGPKDVTWHKYTPADPPKGDTSYLVVGFYPNKDRTLHLATFDETKYRWSTHLDFIVTHYAKVEFP